MPTQTLNHPVQAIPEILQLLEQGEVVIIPTATTYAFVCDGENAKAVARIHQLKRWSSPNPLAVFSTRDRLSPLAHINADADLLLQQFPAPLTLIVPKTDQAPAPVTAGYPSLLVCCPDEFVQKLVESTSLILAGGSASLSTDLKATTARSAMQLFEGEVPLIVDGGPSKYGRGGTMVDCTLDRPTILKYGPISFDDLRPLLPNIELPSHMRK
ncbi:MAG: L-threonylcarbamoyladenylate synthase [Phormidium sp.]